MVSCQKGPTCHAYAWQIGPFWQDTIELYCFVVQHAVELHYYSSVFLLHHTIVVCLSTTRGINDKSRVDVRLAVL